jgi:hypothetical protein
LLLLARSIESLPLGASPPNSVGQVDGSDLHEAAAWRLRHSRAVGLLDFVQGALDDPQAIVRDRMLKKPWFALGRRFAVMVSLKQYTAVDDELGTGEVTGVIGRQKHKCLSDFLGLAEAAERNHRLVLRDDLRCIG